jgi:hypothetical protein
VDEEDVGRGVTRGWDGESARLQCEIERRSKNRRGVRCSRERGKGETGELSIEGREARIRVTKEGS